MNNVSIWLSTMRLRTLPLSVSGIILASFLAIYEHVFDWKIAVLSILTTLSLQILSNLANDYGDGVKGTDNNDRIGPERAIQSGIISPTKMLKAIKINTLISISLATMLIYYAFGVNHFWHILIFFSLGVLCVISAIRYTVGSNAYGYKGLGDIFVFVFFGLVSVIGCYVLYAKTIDRIVFLPACAIGFLSVGVLNLNNMRDMVSDKKSNKMTLAVKLGPKKVKKYHVIIIVLAIVLSALHGFLYYNSPYNLIYFIAYIPLIIHLKTINKNSDNKLIDPELKKLALTTVFLAILMGMGHLF